MSLIPGIGLYKALAKSTSAIGNVGQWSVVCQKYAGRRIIPMAPACMQHILVAQHAYTIPFIDSTFIVKVEARHRRSRIPHLVLRTELLYPRLSVQGSDMVWYSRVLGSQQ